MNRLLVYVAVVVVALAILAAAYYAYYKKVSGSAWNALGSSSKPAKPNNHHDAAWNALGSSTPVDPPPGWTPWTDLGSSAPGSNPWEDLGSSTPAGSPGSNPWEDLGSSTPAGSPGTPWNSLGSSTPLLPPMWDRIQYDWPKMQGSVIGAITDRGPVATDVAWINANAPHGAPGSGYMTEADADVVCERACGVQNADPVHVDSNCDCSTSPATAKSYTQKYVVQLPPMWDRIQYDWPGMRGSVIGAITDRGPVATDVAWINANAPHGAAGSGHMTAADANVVCERACGVQSADPVHVNSNCDCGTSPAAAKGYTQKYAL
jgi:hypothetical protein